MPVKPSIDVRTNASWNVLNAIRNNTTLDYKEYVPVATPDANSIKAIGAVIFDYTALQNTFLNALINRIARQVIISKSYENPLAKASKKGFLQFGETVQEIFIDLVKVNSYDIEKAQDDLFKIGDTEPNVKSVFHVCNYQKFYKLTIRYAELRKAFLSWENMDSFIQNLIAEIYTSANYDEFLVTKYLLAKVALEGKINCTGLPSVNSDNIRQQVSTIKSVSNKMTFMSRDYNMSGVRTHTQIADQFIFVKSDFDSSMTTEVLATSFNMTMAEFLGHRILIDTFSPRDFDRLDEIFKDDKNYHKFTQDEIDLLDKLQVLIIDKDFLQIYDNLAEFRSVENAQGLYWIYDYHVWQTFAVSPFSNAMLFVEGTPTVNNVTVSNVPSTAVNGYIIQPTVKVTTTAFAGQAVKWSITAGAEYVDEFNEFTGSFKIKGALNRLPESSITNNDTITLTATSTADTTKSDSKSIQIAISLIGG